MPLIQQINVLQGALAPAIERSVLVGSAPDQLVQLRRLPGLDRLSSLQDLTSPDHLELLAIDGAHAQRVAEILKVEPTIRHRLFSRETRPERLLAAGPNSKMPLTRASFHSI
jgi:hypothetical protein